jgi:hypothetical protein
LHWDHDFFAYTYGNAHGLWLRQTYKKSINQSNKEIELETYSVAACRREGRQANLI